MRFKACAGKEEVFIKPQFCLTHCVSLFLLQDEDPALRELAEIERENCVKDIQDLSKKVSTAWHFLLLLFLSVMKYN